MSNPIRRYSRKAPLTTVVADKIDAIRNTRGNTLLRKSRRASPCSAIIAGIRMKLMTTTSPHQPDAANTCTQRTTWFHSMTVN